MFHYIPTSILTNTKEKSQPYEKILLNNYLSKTQRTAEETKDELSKILKRVDNALVQYDRAQNWIEDSEKIVDVEYLSELSDFEKILSDHVAKFKYKQKMTVFIVGHSQAIEEKNNLLEELNEFFIEQQESFKKAEETNIDLDFDLDNAAMDVEECLENTKKLANHLNDINEEIIQYLIQTASSKQTKGKKKLEKALKESKEELAILTDKLKRAQKDIESKDSRIGDLVRQLELKTNEVNRYKNNAEILIKKEKQEKLLAEEINKKNNEIKTLNEKLVELENEILKFKRSQSTRRECSGTMFERTKSNLVSLSKRVSQESLSIQKQQNSNEQDTSLESNETITDTQKDIELDNKENDMSNQDQIEQVKLKYEQELKELREYYEEKLNEKQNPVITTVRFLLNRF